MTKHKCWETAISESETDGRIEFRKSLEGLRRHFGMPERRLLLLLAFIVAGVWLFAELADVVFDDEPEFRSVDETLILALREPQDLSDPIGPVTVETAVRDVTALGGTTILGFLTISAAAFLLLRGNRRTALILIVAVVGGTLLSMVFKDFFARPRPTVVPVEVEVLNYSFPSGHAMLAAATYLTIGALLSRTQKRTVIKIYILVLSVVLTVAIGFSRVYLGVHWPTDVLAGWLAGAVWALVVVFAADLWRRS